jgi:hypothetical protein
MRMNCAAVSLILTLAITAAALASPQEQQRWLTPAT